MSSIRWQHNDPNIYLYVNSRWYRYDATSYPVGEGAMGIVYLGFDCATNDKVAVKMLRREYWNDIQIRNRLKLEASIVLNHPHIIRMIGYCEDSSGDGPLYVLSEYICGVTFKEHVLQQLTYLNTSTEERFNKIVSEFIPVLGAVGHLHSYGVIHRDIKPMNLMFQDGYMLKLMDLGIAKADYFFDAHLKGFIGSRPFAAPEQIVADDVEAIIDKRADIYALGVTLSYLLADHFPLQKTDKVPAALADIIATATEKDPDFRYQSTDEMQDALDIYLADYASKRYFHGKQTLTWIFTVGVISVLILFIITMLFKI